MKIEIGKYYLRRAYDGPEEFRDIEELIYVFGEESAEEAASMTYPEGTDPDKVKNMLGIKVMPFITMDNFLQFQQSMYPETVYKSTGESVYHKDWVEIVPSDDIIKRFEKSSYFMHLVRKFVNHMSEEYSRKYKKEYVWARDVILK